LGLIEAWESKSLQADLWIPPPDGSLKANFDVAVRSNFSVNSTVVVEEKGKVLAVCTSKLNTIEVNEGEAFATCIASLQTSILTRL
jgi:hypothetical protein